MSLPPHLFASAFKEQRLGLVLMLIVGIMVYLGTLALSAQVFMGGGLFTWGQEIQGQMTLEIPLAQEDSSDQQTQKLTQIMDVLRAIPHVKDVIAVPRSETSRLLRPWIDDPLLLSALPLPTLIDIVTEDHQKIDENLLHTRLQKLAPEAKLNRHGAWIEKLKDLVDLVTLLAGFMVLLTTLALIVANSLVCKVAFATQNHTIDLLHVMGATDRDIAKQFRVKVTKVAWPPALFGYLFALATIASITFLFQQFWDISTGFHLSFLYLALWIGLVPCLGVLAAFVTAHISVMHFLRRPS